MPLATTWMDLERLMLREKELISYFYGPKHGQGNDPAMTLEVKVTYEENAVAGKWKEPQSLHGCGTGLPCHLRPLTHLRFLGKSGHRGMCPGKTL